MSVYGVLWIANTKRDASIVQRAALFGPWALSIGISMTVPLVGCGADPPRGNPTQAQMPVDQDRFITREFQLSSEPPPFEDDVFPTGGNLTIDATYRSHRPFNDKESGTVSLRRVDNGHDVIVGGTDFSGAAKGNGDFGFTVTLELPDTPGQYLLHIRTVSGSGPIENRLIEVRPGKSHRD